MDDVHKRRYLVIGGTSGIGRATVEYLVAQAGAAVIFCGRNVERGKALAAGLEARAPGCARFFAADVTSQLDVDALFAFVRASFPRLDGAFNAAGVIGRDTRSRGVRFHESAEAELERVFAVNVKGIWRCLKHELALMDAQQAGSIVNCSSVAGLRSADSRSVAYTASKHALVGMTRALAVEYAAAGIRVNAVCPGVIDTEMLGGLKEHLVRDLVAKNPGARLGTAEEVATAVEFLLSERASYISGAVLTVDAGGLTGAL